MVDVCDLLRSGRTILMDGAMATELQRAGMLSGECYEAWNLTNPQQVLAIHQSYVDVGARCLLTNTFQSNPQALSRHGLAHEMTAINHRAVELARTAAGNDRAVIASIGPMDLKNGTSDLDDTLLSLSDADAWLLETWSDHFELALERALASDINPNRVPVLLSLTYRAGDVGAGPVIPPTGMTPAEAATCAAAFPIAALGVNCGREMNLPQLLFVLKSYRERTDLPLLARPNAGTPVQMNDVWKYPYSPEEMAGWIPQLQAAGATLIGGCCGTTPEYIQTFSRVVK